MGYTVLDAAGHTLLLMVALGWMNLLWMSLFASSIIFGEKVWIRGGIWIGRGAGIGFVPLGILGILDLDGNSNGKYASCHQQQ